MYLVGVQDENTLLRKNLNETRGKMAELANDAESARRYRDILGFTREFPARKLMADVVRSTSDTWNSTLLVDAGTRRGVQVAMGVASVDGVFGQVISVSPGISKIQSILHPDTGVSAILQKSRVQGVVSGTGRDTCHMKFSSRFDRIVLGEMAVTSGLDGAFPPNIPIGRVSRIEKGPGEIFQMIEIIPLVETATVEEVMIFFTESLEIIQ